MANHTLFAAVLLAKDGDQPTTPREELMRDILDFLDMAGNTLCDDCHPTLSNQAGWLMRRVQRDLDENFNGDKK